MPTELMQPTLCVLGVNLLSFLIFGLDKLLARKQGRRVPEASLLTLGILGGSVGAMLGMLVFRHKTAARRHPAFCWGLPLVFLLQLAVCTWLLWRS